MKTKILFTIFLLLAVSVYAEDKVDLTQFKNDEGFIIFRFNI